MLKNSVVFHYSNHFTSSAGSKTAPEHEATTIMLKRWYTVVSCKHLVEFKVINFGEWAVKRGPTPYQYLWI